MSLYKELRKKYPDFYYRDYIIGEDENEVRITYHFEIAGLAEFRPSWVFYKRCADRISDTDTFKSLVFSLGLVELVSYWKPTCSPNVHVMPHKLDGERITWWKKLYFGGLGEFFYLNGISPDFNDFMTIYTYGEDFNLSQSQRALSGCLVPIGGGKDSAVTLEVLRGEDITPFIINGRGATENTCTVAGFDKSQTDTVVRRLDPEMIALNKKGFLNGHTPFSAIVAFSSLIDAYINGREYIVLSNESSANESTVEGSDVNHQFSKGFEFEKEFRRYEETYLKTGISYFSLLRVLSEFQIAALFSKYEKYHPIFRSCNAGSKTDSWCCNCPKCLFVYIILSPFLSEEKLVKIFGENLLDKEILREDFDKLTGIVPEKPFECVGSRDEVRCALTLTVEKYKRKELPLLLKSFYDRGDFPRDAKKYFDFYDDENFLTPDFEKRLKGELDVYRNNQSS